MMMDIFKIPSPNELKLSVDEYKDILYIDRDPLVPNTVYSDSDNEDDFSLGNIRSVKRDFVEEDTCLIHPSKLKEIDQVKPAVKTEVSRIIEVQQTELSSGCPAKVDDPVTLNWLETNFECHRDYSIPRGDMFHIFAQYCLENDIRMTSNQATFGKSVRSIFPSLKTRRIGIRGQSRYHYDGIRPKMNSYVSEKLIPRKHGNVKLQVDWKEYKPNAYQERRDIEFGPSYPSDHLVTILIPTFPTARTISVDNAYHGEISMFLMLYRCYAVDILKNMMKTRFSQLEHITMTFWKNLPAQIVAVLTHKDTLEIIRTCDSLIYTCVIKLLVPSILIPLPSGMIRLLEKTFGTTFISQQCSAISSCPPVLQIQSLEEVVKFSKNLLERLQLCTLCGQARETLQCAETTKSIRDMVKRLDPQSIVDVAIFPSQTISYKRLYEQIENGVYDFQQLLAERAKFDRYVAWVRSLVVNMVNTAKKTGQMTTDTARVIILELSYITGVIAREVSFKASETVQRAFHDVEAFFISYVKFLLETEHLN